LQGIDRELKKGCEDVISGCADSVCGSIRDWTNSQSTKSPPPSATIIEGLDENFRLSCHRDLRFAVSQMKLYLEDDRTVHILLLHVQDKIVDEYVNFKETVADRFGNAGLLSVPGLKDLLKEICEEGASER
jgi:conserved oligomeric Golgi complex subunit 3